MAKFETIDAVDWRNKRALLRLDLNVPLENGKVRDATRIERVVPTIRELREKGAAVLILKARAEVLEKGDGALRSERLDLDRPCVIRLIRYVRIPRDVHRRKITRKAVLARDAYTCQYCGREASGLTVDHVIPRSKGGRSVWENIVASCAPCNRKKGNRTPHEARMHPSTAPRPPGPTVFIRIASPRVPVAWEPYLVVA